MRYLDRLQPLALLVMRLALGAVMLDHGYHKVFGGLHHHAQFVASLGLPAWTGYVSSFVEFFGGSVPVVFVGWFLLLWGVFTFFMWFGTFRANRVLQSIFLSLWITFLLLALGEWFGMKALHVAGGYFGLLTAALAFYLAAAEVINETRGEVVLPIGPYRTT